MDLNAARRHAAVYLLNTDPGDPPLAVAPWGWSNGAQWLLVADTPRALQGWLDDSVQDAPFFLVDDVGHVVEIDWEHAHQLQASLKRHGDPEPAPRYEDTPSPL